MKKKQVLEALTKDGNLRVPCSRYGSDSIDCARVAYRMTKNMEYHGVYDHPVGIADYEANMSLVVNDHDDVAYILKDYKIPRDTTNRKGAGKTACRYCGLLECNYDCDESQAGGFKD